MKNIRSYTALCLAILFIPGCGTAVTKDPVGNAETSIGNESIATEKPDASGPARPQDDFYRYINEETLKTLEFPYGEDVASVGLTDSMIEEQSKAIIKEVSEGSGYKKGTEEYLIKRAYDLYMEYDFDNAPVPSELDDLLHEIDGVQNMNELLKLDARMQREYGVPGFFNLTVDVNYLSPGYKILTFGQYSGILDAGFKSLEDSFASLNTLKETGSRFYRTTGHDRDSADETGTELAQIALDVYNKTDMDILSAAMPFEHFNIMTREEVSSILSNLDLTAYLDSLGISAENAREFAVNDAGQLKALNDMLSADNLEALKAWKMSALGMKYRRFLDKGYDSLKDFAVIDYNTPEDQVLNEIFYEYFTMVDPLYVERYYSEEADSALISMCDMIKNSYRDLIKEADWLSSGTITGLLNKLEKIEYVTGMDVKRHDPAEYADIDGKDYFQFYLSFARKGIQETNAQLGKKADTHTVNMPMQMVNACYDPSLNTITVTVAIMNPPEFDLNADMYTNLGGLGMTIAHEMGHAFDSNCILFDENGLYDPNWIAPEDMKALTARNEQAVSYFEDNFTVFSVYHVDGAKTLGENYADLGAMECITRIPETDEQWKLLFENYARIWCEKRTDSSIIDQIDSDEHSPAEIRTNAILSTLDTFIKTYDVKPGDGMYIPPENRISRWY